MNTSEIRQQINQYLDQLSPDRLLLAAELLASLAEKDRQDKIRHQGQIRAEFVSSIQGKYAHLPNSSEQFARSKQEEIVK
ncbi:MAG: hypothetical protein KME26_21875 [Oscillatoria princeps RMCB-10]|nr:hypothetical protein [Oscillatoria princeps RMCB-10]